MSRIFKNRIKLLLIVVSLVIESSALYAGPKDRDHLNMSLSCPTSRYQAEHKESPPDITWKAALLNEVADATNTIVGCFSDAIQSISFLECSFSSGLIGMGGRVATSVIGIACFSYKAFQAARGDGEAALIVTEAMVGTGVCVLIHYIDRAKNILP